MTDRAVWSLSTLLTHVGREIGVSEWLLIDQRRINDFATVTEDRQFIHTDPVRAGAGPFAGTIAHGFLTLSLLSAMERSCLPTIAGVKAELNYGFDRVRFLTPVRAGAHVRARFTLASLSEREAERWQMSLTATVEIEHGAKPALVAEWRILFVT